MKTKVNRLLIRDDMGIEHAVSARCANGDFKKKYIRGLIDQGLLLPTQGVVTLLGELIEENRLLKKELRETIDELMFTEDAINAIDEIIDGYYTELDERD